MRLIDADCVKLVETIGRRAFRTRSDIQDWLNNAPTVDAIQVVRCKDCKYFSYENMECENEAVSTDYEGGAQYSLNFYLDDFCSYGERKDNTNECR